MPRTRHGGIIAQMYGNAEGTARDFRKRFYWLRKAARQGHANAQKFLGLDHYYYGYGVAKPDYLRAYIWLTLAGRNGARYAKAFVNGPAAKMTPAQIAEAKRAADKCWKKPATCP